MICGQIRPRRTLNADIRGQPPIRLLDTNASASPSIAEKALLYITILTLDLQYIHVCNLHVT